MAVRDIVRYGQPILKKACQPLTDLSRLTSLVPDMFDTMYEAEGIGLAANQIGVNLNVMVIDVTHTEEAEEPFVFVNGAILERGGEEVLEEGCLSLPEIRLRVKRPEWIRFKYQSMDGESQTRVFKGLLGRAIQHEMDHLQGILIIDRVSKLERLKYQNQLRKIQQEAHRVSPAKSAEKPFVL